MKRKIWLPLIFLCVAFSDVAAIVIKAGMTLKIMVKDNKELSDTVRVQDDGTIDYPMLQDTPIINKTTGELQDMLTYKLARVIESPLVLVTVVTETPIAIYVLGQVKKPGLVAAPPGAALQEVLLQAEGVTEQADLDRVKIVHKNDGDDKAEFYNLQRFMNTGDLGYLPKLQDGDRVIVLSSKKSKYIKILGAVNKPGFYPIGEETSIFDLLYLAGGPAGDANLSKVRVISSAGGQREDYMLDMQKFIDEGKTDNLPNLGEGDVVIVYAQTFTWGKVLDAVRDVVTLVTAWIVITQVVK